MVGRGAQGNVIAALLIETTIVEVQRHHKRSNVFPAALRDLQQMLVRGEIEGGESLSSFGEHDGILFVDAAQQIRYVSGVAENLYRKLGHAESLLRHSITSLGRMRALISPPPNGRCLEVETHEGDLIWVRKAFRSRPAPPLILPSSDRSSCFSAAFC